MEWWDSGEYREGVPFAVDTAGNWRDVDDVPRGKACGCFCADCRGELIARQGDVRVHHFAHSDRRECRHALEASLFGMTLRVLAEPDAQLALPPYGDRRALAGQVGVPWDRNPFKADEPIVPASRLPVTGATFTTSSVAETALESPDIIIPGKLAIHLLSYRKTYHQLSDLQHRGELPVLGVNLRAYAQRWWQVCDEQKEQRMNAAINAISLLRAWLADDRSGRGWFYHPAIRGERARLAAWQKEENARQEKLLRESWTAPSATEHPEPHSGECIATAAGIERRPPKFMKPIRADAMVSDERAVHSKLWWHQTLRSWCYVAGAGELAPATIRPLLSPTTDWLPVRSTDREHLSSTRPIAPLPASEAPRFMVNEPPREDTILGTSSSHCWCGAPKIEVQFGSGPYQGRRGVKCSSSPRHPFTLLP